MKKGGGVSTPPFLCLLSGPVFVCGNALCLHEDLERARQKYGDVPVIAVNGASREVRAFALYSGHPTQFIKLRWIENQRSLFHDQFTVHGSNTDPDVRASCTWVDHWWEGPRSGHGTSVWGARKLAHFMGFDLVILCGAPLVPGPYAGYRLPMQMARMDVMQRYRKIVQSETEWHDGCLSLSGWTAEILGRPS